MNSSYLKKSNSQRSDIPPLVRVGSNQNGSGRVDFVPPPSSASIPQWHELRDGEEPLVTMNGISIDRLFTPSPDPYLTRRVATRLG
jgi:hypothetical protein